ncbi:MAG: response regulator transcription factor [Flavobacteriales bacterium]|nr:response regulator transcription factor [Flavobacteriia bacterium]NCP05793.1 response regulator transcription factor [Flavobacteriales bacterium]PIV94480.1 MAG: DNA-binding response regulator [Flavobacteriaceae bacterium CG17_big_fil_post_rev_8_21_14_2_50_33_15]PIY11292.1 MAG: DNA-binding response regulator [Flavobacteriaceae bacterium CG_4_10_14_3_um_filter_33_47]PJB20645.1 MAG: DNA-binding response regulator [Flavobacteriaceae bacterium CG_4_9_14_3_um_filter_33_16]
MNIKIAIVDDNSFLITAVKEKLSFFDDLQIKFTALNGAELLTMLSNNHNIDVILMDIEMPVLNGIETTEIVKQKYPHIKIIMLTVFDNDEHIFNAIKAGADGYLLKEINAKDLHEGLLDTINGGAAMNPSIAMKTLKLLRNPVDFDDEKEDIKLSEREIQVLEQLSKGLSYNIIADNLFLSTGTIRKHIENIYKKLQVHNKLEAVAKAKRNNLI